MQDQAAVDPFEEADELEGFEMSGEGMSREELGDSGGRVNKEGRYHFEIRDVVPKLSLRNKKGEQRSPSMRFDLVVAHGAPGQSEEGALLFHEIYVGSKGGGPPAEGSVKVAMAFALAAGVAKEVDVDGKTCIVDASTGKGLTKETFMQAAGRHVIADVEFEEGTGDYKGRFRIPYTNVWSPLDDAVKDTPKDMEALQLAGYEVGGSAGESAPDALDDPDL